MLRERIKELGTQIGGFGAQKTAQQAQLALIRDELAGLRHGLAFGGPLALTLGAIVVASAYRLGEVVAVKHDEQGTVLDVRVPPQSAGEFSEFAAGSDSYVDPSPDPPRTTT